MSRTGRPRSAQPWHNAPEPPEHKMGLCLTLRDRFSVGSWWATLILAGGIPAMRNLSLEDR